MKTINGTCYIQVSTESNLDNIKWVKLKDRITEELSSHLDEILQENGIINEEMYSIVCDTLELELE